MKRSTNPIEFRSVPTTAQTVHDFAYSIGDSTQINSGSDLTANHINQAALIIGGTPGSPAILTIAASDPSGDPLSSESNGLILTSSLKQATALGADSVSAPGLAVLTPSFSDGEVPPSSSAASGSDLRTQPLGVPEPSGVILLAIAAAALWASTKRCHCYRTYRRICHRWATYCRDERVSAFIDEFNPAGPTRRITAPVSAYGT